MPVSRVSTDMPACRLCGQEAIHVMLDLGKQPVCHHFLSQASERQYQQTMIMGQCQSCGLIQLIRPMPTEQLIPNFNWLECIEPEDHLDELVSQLCQLEGISQQSRIGGVSFKEDSTLLRFNKLNYNNTYRFKAHSDLGINNSLAGIESVVERLKPDIAAELQQQYGQFDILIARHILEHADKLLDFLTALRMLITDNGYLVFEIPDCKAALDHYDYTNFWEEHVSYFTPETFYQCFSYAGLQVESFKKIHYSLEDSYIAIVKKTDDLIVPAEFKALSAELQRFRKYADNLPAMQKKYQTYLRAYKRQKGKIALFGASHMACVFINVLKLQEFVEFVVDDNPHKNNLFLPGSGLPIVSSEALLKHDIKLCLLTLSERSERKVLANNQAFLEQGGLFKSIFPENERALDINESI